MHKNRPRKILTTCALPYSNGEIHIGHLVEYLQADFWVRFQKMLNNRCLFFCADDTHGTPIMIAAKKQGISPEELVTQKRQSHIEDFKKFEIDFTHYSDTNTKINQKLSNAIYEKMVQGNHIHSKEIEQTYCDTCQMFLPDRFIKGTCPNCNSENQYGDSCDRCGTTYHPLEMKNSYCVTCENPPNIRTSQHLFFRLADFQNFLSDWVPQHTSNEVSKKLKEWFTDSLRDWNISRDAPYFGFQIPDHPNKFFYVWVDAPIGYIATTEEWCQQSDIHSYVDIWKNPDWEIHHFIGKDIIYFHGLFWPAMLKSAGLSTPTYLHTHGFLTINGEKMSKSKNMFVNAKDYLNTLDPLYLRYYFFTKISSDINDIDLNWNDFKDKINGLLLAKITNIASRCFQMLHKKCEGKLGMVSSDGNHLLTLIRNQKEEIAQLYEKGQFSKISIIIRDLAEEVNRYLDKKAPWKMDIEDHSEMIISILTDGLNAFRLIVIYLTPVLPSYSKKVSDFFQEEEYIWESLDVTLSHQKTFPYQHLIKKIEQEWIDPFLQG